MEPNRAQQSLRAEERQRREWGRPCWLEITGQNFRKEMQEADCSLVPLGKELPELEGGNTTREQVSNILTLGKQRRKFNGLSFHLKHVERKKNQTETKINRKK
jgi:hypothetical protein